MIGATYFKNNSLQELDITGITDGNIPYMSASGFADSPLSTDGTDVLITDGSAIEATGGGPTIVFDDTNNYLEITDCNVGIGTSTPDQKLHLLDTSSHCQLLIEASGTNKDPQLYLRSQSQDWYVYNDESQSNVLRLSDGSPRMDWFVGGIVNIRTGPLGIKESNPVTLIELTDTSPYITLHNSTHEDTDGGRESRIISRGEQSGGEETILGYLEFCHDGASDDQKGLFRVLLNDGDDGTTPSLTRLEMDTTGIGFFGVTPQAQQSHIVDADGTLADITTKFNTLLADLEGYGLLASS